MFSFIRRYAVGLFVLLVTLIILFTVLAFLAGHGPSITRGLAGTAAKLATPRG